MFAYKICENLKLIFEQSQYNLLHRDRIEREYANLFKNFKLGIIVWSSLFSGVLTGKYLKDVPDDSRYKKHKELNEYFENKEIIDKKIEKLENLVKNKFNCSLAQLNIALIIKNFDVSNVILV